MQVAQKMAMELQEVHMIRSHEEWKQEKKTIHREYLLSCPLTLQLSEKYYCIGSQYPPGI